MSTWLDTDVKPIKKEEAEETVKRLRQELREAHQARLRGDRAEADRACGSAGSKMAAVGKMLERRLVNYAESKLGSENRQLVDEALGDIFEQLYKDFMDLESTRSAFYETAFNRRVMWTALDVIKKLKVRHGLPARGGPQPWDERPASMEDLQERATEGEATPLREAEPEAQEELERLVGPNLLRDVIAAMPDHKHVRVLVLHTLKGYTFDQTAEAVGVSEKTARRYYNRAVEIARRVAG